MISKIVSWLISTRTLSWPIRCLRKILREAKIIFLIYDNPERSEVIDLINKIHKETPMLLRNDEAYQVFTVVKRIEKVKGDIAEVGVYMGGSAKLICEAKGDKCLHLFDTFEGIPEVDQVDAPFCEGQFSASLESVKDYLKNYKNVYFYKGIFPASSKPVKDKKFSFVHIDVDTYKSTLSCLEFFYPRMNQGGIIISHDYVSNAGVRRAFDEFFGDKPEPIIELAGSQCLIAKI